MVWGCWTDNELACAKNRLTPKDSSVRVQGFESLVGLRVPSSGRRVQSSEFRVWGVFRALGSVSGVGGFDSGDKGVQGVAFRIWGSGFWVSTVEFRVSTSGFRVKGFECRIKNLEFWV
jgi:hypothetical protein